VVVRTRRQAGKYLDRITIERASAGELDADGQVPVFWLTYIERFADIRETPGKERVEAGRLIEAATATIRVRRDAATASITAADRVRARGHLWQIRGVGDLRNSHQEVELLVERGVAAGEGVS